jgi:hypothetical protein
MRIPLLMIFQFFFIISAWATKALEDGKITTIEGLELVISLAGILGVKPEFVISDFVQQSEIDPVEDKIDLELDTLSYHPKDPAFPITKE